MLGYLIEKWQKGTDKAIAFTMPTFKYDPPTTEDEEMTASIRIRIIEYTGIAVPIPVKITNERFNHVYAIPTGSEH
jgi:hypothetical protein